MAKTSPNKSRSFRADRWSWFIFLTLLFVGGPATYAWFHRRVRRETSVTHPIQTPFRLAILEYGRLAPPGKQPAISGAQLEQQLRLLRSRGFTPVSASQVAEAYAHGGFLPPRSILLTFDGGYLSSYEEAHPVLARLQWPALMMLDTGRQEHRDPNFLYWDRLQLMLDSGIWELGTHGHRPLAKNGSPLAPLATGEAAFSVSREIIESQLRKASVFAFAHLASLAPDLQALASPASPGRPTLAFRTDLFGVNGPDDPPLHLNRLEVEPNWSAGTLLERVEQAMAAPAPAHTSTRAAWDHWIPDAKAGRALPAQVPAGLLLEGRQRSDVWLAGSRWASGWVMQTRFRLESGEFWVAQEESYGGRHWRFGGKAGVLYLQDRTPGMPPTTLARFPYPQLTHGWHELRITRRGPGLWIEMDAVPVAPSPCLLPERYNGHVGIISAPEGGSPAHLEIASVQWTDLPYRVAPISPDPGPGAIQILSEQASCTAALSPVWITRSAGHLEEAPLNQDLFRMLQRRLALDILPQIRLMDVDHPEDAAWLATLAQRAAKAGWSGVCLNLSALQVRERGRWEQAARKIEQNTKSQGIRIITQVSNMNEGVLR
nr:polysaccharide deacetylase family protein [uncultured Holophaga sp.]